MIKLQRPHITDLESEKNAYEEIYSDQGIRQLDSFYYWLLDLMNPKPGQSLLDVSCGEGKLVALAQERGVRATGVDFSESALRTAQQQVNATVFSVTDAQELSIRSHSLDFVANIGSLTHYLSPALGVREMRRILKSDGVACVLLPNTYSLFGNVKHVVQTGEVYQGIQPIERYNTLSGWCRLLSDNGLAPFRIVKYEMPRPYTLHDLVWYGLRPAKTVHLFLALFLPLALANCFVYLCRPSGLSSIG